jgi:RNA polymerase sigma factor for flagellar operon FliA
MVMKYREQQQNLAPHDREQMIIDHLPQVRYIASCIHERLPRHVQMDDLVSAGILGLIAAVDSYDAGRNVKLRTYAEHKIRGYILNSISKVQGTPRQRNSARRDIEKAISSAEQRIGATPGAEDIAAELNMSLESYFEVLNEVQAVSLGSLESFKGEDEGASVLKYFVDSKAESPARVVERDHLRRLLVEALQHLPEVERTVLNFYYLEGLNLREIGSILDVHMTRVSQIKTQAVLRLRTRLQTLWPGKVELA